MAKQAQKQKKILSKANGDACPKVRGKKELSGVLKEVFDQNGRIKPTTKGFMIYPEDKTQDGVLIHTTDSDHRAAKNARSRLGDRGFEL